MLVGGTPTSHCSLVFHLSTTHQAQSYRWPWSERPWSCSPPPCRSKPMNWPSCARHPRAQSYLPCRWVSDRWCCQQIHDAEPSIDINMFVPVELTISHFKDPMCVAGRVLTGPIRLIVYSLRSLRCRSSFRNAQTTIFKSRWWIVQCPAPKKAIGVTTAWKNRKQEEKMWKCEDVKMWRCVDEKMWRRGQEGKRARGEDVKMWGCEDVRMRRCEDEKMWRCEDEKIWRWTDVKMWRWEDVKMWRCEDEKMWRWADVKMWRWEDVKMWRWENVKMSRCEDKKMWRREDVKMWRCEDEKMWRWEDEIQTSTIGRTLRSDALGKNSPRTDLMQQKGARTNTLIRPKNRKHLVLRERSRRFLQYIFLTASMNGSERSVPTCLFIVPVFS